MKEIDVAIIGAGPAGIGISAMLGELGVKSHVVLERKKIGESFERWPKEMKLITPSFTTNFYGHLDLNSVPELVRFISLILPISITDEFIFSAILCIQLCTSWS